MRKSSRSRAAGVVIVLAAIACGSAAVIPTNAGDGGGTSGGQPTTGSGGGSLAGRRPFPNDNPWNTDISGDTVDPKSSTLIASCGNRNLHPDFGTVWDGAPNGIPYVVVHSSQARVPVTFDYSDESDPGPYPIPADAPIEGGSNSDGDRHVLVVDVDAWKLYELFDAHPQNVGASWHAGSGAVFDLGSNALRPAGWTSADAAGLPIFPGLVRYDEGVRVTGPALREQRHEQRASGHGDARAPQGKLRHDGLLGARARDSARDEEVRDVRCRQRLGMVRQRSTGSTVERRRSRDAGQSALIGVRGCEVANLRAV
jgi:hypothetical protein